MRILFASLLVGVFAQTGFAESELPKTLTHASAPATVLKVKKIGEIALRFEVAKGFHVQANPADPPLIPTNVTLSKNPDFEIFTPKYPKGKMAMVKGLGREITTYEGSFTVTVPLRSRKTTKPGSYKVGGDVRFQACDDKLCFPPQTAPFSAMITLK